MNALLEFCGPASTYLLFTAITWRMLVTPAPSKRRGCRVRWTCWGLLHLAAAVSAMGYLFDQLGDPEPSDWHLCLMRTSIAMLLLFRWRRREDSE